MNRILYTIPFYNATSLRRHLEVSLSWVFVMMIVRIRVTVVG